MAIDPRSIMQLDPNMLQRLGNPTGGKLTQLGQMYQQNQQNQLANRVALQENARAKQKQQMQMADTSSALLYGYGKSIMDELGEDATEQDLIRSQRQALAAMPRPYRKMLMENGGPFSSREELEQATKSAYKVQVALHPEKYATEDDDLTKWETELAMIELKNANPEGWTTTQQEQLEALQRQTFLPLGSLGPTKASTIQSTTALDVLTYKGDKLAGNIENESAYVQDLDAEKRRLIQENQSLYRRGKAKLMSDAEATAQAHENLKKYLKKSDVVSDLGEKIGVDISNPLGRKYVYDTAGKNPVESKLPELPEGMSEAMMDSVLRANNYDDTIENRKRVIEDYKAYKAGR